VVGGSYINYEDCAGAAARMALQYLYDPHLTTPQAIYNTDRARVVDADQLKRWNIPLDRVPADTFILNQPTPAAYLWKIAVCVVLIVLEGGLIILLLVTQRRHRRAEVQLRASEAQRNAAIVEERTRMARDMHDTLAQGFTGVIVQMEAAKLNIHHQCLEEALQHIQSAGAQAAVSLKEARRSIRGLRPGALETENFWVAMENLMKEMTAATSLRTGFTVSGQPYALFPFEEDNLLRIFQEILTNALKYSRAGQIVAHLSFAGQEVALEVADDGAGFDVNQPREGMGLTGIQERVQLMNGSVAIDSGPGAGTRIRVCITHSPSL
jgi:signal transduction histidine kinase